MRDQYRCQNWFAKSKTSQTHEASNWTLLYRAFFFLVDTVPEGSVHFRLQATTVRGHRRCVRYGGATFYRGKGTGGRPLPRYDGTNGTARQRFTSVTVQGLSAYPANGNGSLPLPNVPWFKTTAQILIVSCVVSWSKSGGTCLVAFRAVRLPTVVGSVSIYSSTGARV